MKRFGSKLLGVQLLLVAVAFCLQPQRVQAQKEEPWQMLGIWNINFAKSPLFAGPMEQSHTLKYWWEGGQLKHVVNTVDTKGEHRVGGWTVDQNFVTITPPTTTVRRLDAYTSQIINKRDGKVVNLLTRIVWKDGKSATFVRQRPDADGVMTVYGVELYERQ